MGRGLDKGPDLLNDISRQRHSPVAFPGFRWPEFEGSFFAALPGSLYLDHRSPGVESKIAREHCGTLTKTAPSAPQKAEERGVVRVDLAKDSVHFRVVHNVHLVF